MPDLDLDKLVADLIPGSVIFADHAEHVAALRDRAKARLEPLLCALKEAREEVLYWRRNVAAHLRTGVILARAAQQRGDQAEAVRIAVMSINPMIAALDNALSGNVHYPLCEHCGRPVKPGDAVIHYEDGEVAHLDCDNPQSPDPLPPEATRHEVHEDDTPEGIREALEDARAFVHEDEPNEGEVGA
jgi:Demethylmenaquinone methyltransferase